MHTETRRKRQPLVPDQHGAWAFLLLPVLLGLAAGGWSTALPVVLVAWVAAYPLSWALTGVLAAPRPQRFQRSLVAWAAIAVPAAVGAALLRPWLLYAGGAYAAAFLVNLWFARRRRERDLANDLVLVAECAALVPIIAGLSESDGWAVPFDVLGHRKVVVLTLACALALLGSTLHVKSLIRERRNPRFAAASRSFAIAAVAVIAAAVASAHVSVVLVVPFVVQAVRAFLVRDSRMRPARIGLIELGCLLVLVVSAWAV